MIANFIHNIANFINNRWTWLTLRLLLGGLFIFTSIPKIAEIDEFVGTIIGYGILPTGLAETAGRILPWVELYIGCSLMLGIFVRSTSALILPLSIIFGAAGIYAMVTSFGISCGCFGAFIQISHPIQLAIDGIMLVLALVLVTRKGKEFLVLGQVFDRITPGFRRLLSRTSSIVAMVIPGVVLLGGYAFGIEWMRNLAPDLPKMMPNTAVGLFLAGVSLFLYTISSKKHEAYSVSWIQKLLAVIVFLLGAATNAEYLLGINLGIDELLFRDLSPEATFPGRPSPHTSLGFMLTGVSLMLIDSKRLWVLQLSQQVGVTIGLGAIIAIIGYVYSSLPFYALTAYTGMAIHTALNFLAISCGVIFAGSYRGLAKVSTAHSERAA